MRARKIFDRVHWMGVIDWNRRLFDSLIPLPDGTTYNAYFVEGSEKTALLDTVEPEWAEVLMSQLSSIKKIDYIVSHHAEQDHSGAIPRVLEKYPDAIVLCSEKAKELLLEHINIPSEKIRTVKDGETLSLGDKTLKFIYTPWVHWPETMSTYLLEDRALFSCDFFGSHFATSELCVGANEHIGEAAKRYYAEIMMPFRKIIQKNIEIVKSLDIKIIAPSHGPIYNDPGYIISKYEDWVSDRVKNQVVIPYISMHGSTGEMVDHLASALLDRGIGYEIFELSACDIGKLAMYLVDAATVIIGTPTVNVGAHPQVAYAASLINLLRPKFKYAAVIGSYGWSSKAVESITAVMPNIKVEMLNPVLCKGHPCESTYKELDALADSIAEKHSKLQ